MKILRVMVIADDPLARAGLAAMLEASGIVQVIGQRGVQAGLVDDLWLYRPEVVVWDMGWEITHAGLESLHRTLECDPPLECSIVLLAPDQTPVSSLYVSGLRGILPRGIDTEHLTLALQAVVHGLAVFDPEWLPAADPRPGDSVELPHEALTPREIEVLHLITEGLSNKAIARQLGISDHTVKFHITALMQKLGAQSRTEVVVRAVRSGLIML
jgi:DNA-binding NarL/FixJ family response regulator